MVAWVVIGVTVVVGLFILIGIAWFAWDSDKRVKAFQHSTDLIPGKPSRAPESWTTDNHPEALLHRRIRYAIADVHNNPGVRHYARSGAARDDLDEAVFELDDRLIAAENMTDEEAHTEAIEAIEAAVETLEALPKALWEAPEDDQVEKINEVAATLRR